MSFYAPDMWEWARRSRVGLACALCLLLGASAARAQPGLTVVPPCGPTPPAACDRSALPPLPASSSTQVFLPDPRPSLPARPASRLRADLQQQQARLGSASATDPARAELLGSVAAIERELARQASTEEERRQHQEQEIRVLAMLVRDHPSASGMDQILFSLARALEQTGQLPRARQVYLQLIRSHPTSFYIADAYASFGEYFLQSGDLSAAQRFFEQVLTLQPRPALHAFALLRLAHVAQAQQDHREALSRYVGLLTYLGQNPSFTKREELLAAAREEMVVSYAAVARPNVWRSFFERYLPRTSDQVAVGERLARALVQRGDLRAARQVLEELVQRYPLEEGHCERVARLQAISTCP